MDIMKYTTKITLFNSYFDCNNKLKPTAIFNIFQDVASIHGELLGVGYEEMLKKQLFWVLSRVKYTIIKQPRINDEVIVETWPNEKGRIDFDRDFSITNKNGELLVMGTSKWCVISVNTRSLERTDNVNYPGTCHTQKMFNEKFIKTASAEISGMPKLTHTVQFSEIDHNMHANNTNYATYVTNALNNTYFNHLQINFISECKLGDQLLIYVQESENGTLVSGYVNEVLKFSALAK